MQAKFIEDDRGNFINLNYIVYVCIDSLESGKYFVEVKDIFGNVYLVLPPFYDEIEDAIRAFKNIKSTLSHNYNLNLTRALSWVLNHPTTFSLLPLLFRF